MAGITTLVIVNAGRRRTPVPRPGHIMRLLVVCPGVLLWLGAPTDVLPLTEPLSIMPWVRNRPTIPLSPKVSVGVQ